MRLVILESPYHADTDANFERNRLYRQQCIQDCLLRGEAPFASHQMYTDALDDSVPAERDLGIAAGYEWWRAACCVVFYVDLGWSEGMRKAWNRARVSNIKREQRSLIAAEDRDAGN